MLWPQKAIVANGSRRTSPAWPTMAAVVLEPKVAALHAPPSQLKVSTASGDVSARGPPKRKTEMGKPLHTKLLSRFTSDAVCVTH